VSLSAAGGGAASLTQTPAQSPIATPRAAAEAFA